MPAQALELLAAARQLQAVQPGLPTAVEEHWLTRLQSSAVALLCVLQGSTLTASRLQAAVQACAGSLGSLRLPGMTAQVK